MTVIPVSDHNSQKLLGSGDPAPFEVLNADSSHPIVLVCEHAGKIVPSCLGDLGVSVEDMNRHIGSDIGAAAVTRQIADHLGVCAVLQPFSRLVIDCNRPPEAADAVPPISDGTKVPANLDLDPAQLAARVDEIFRPFHAKVDALLDAAPRRLAISIHSFNPVLSGVERPWDIGFLFRNDGQTSTELASYLKTSVPDLMIGMNVPYQIDDLSDWFVPQHGEKRGIAHSMIEIRNDHITTTSGQQQWAERLSAMLTQWLKEH